MGPRYSLPRNPLMANRLMVSRHTDRRLTDRLAGHKTNKPTANQEPSRLTVNQAVNRPTADQEPSHLTVNQAVSRLTAKLVPRAPEDSREPRQECLLMVRQRSAALPPSRATPADRVHPGKTAPADQVILEGQLGLADRVHPGKITREGLVVLGAHKARTSCLSSWV
ncbi:hypothetical protein GCM10025779_15890 [Arthrobacter cryoconiti]